MEKARGSQELWSRIKTHEPSVISMLLAKNSLFASFFARIGAEIQQMRRAARDFFVVHAHYRTTYGIAEASPIRSYGDGAALLSFARWLICSKVCRVVTSGYVSAIAASRSVFTYLLKLNNAFAAAFLTETALS